MKRILLALAALASTAHAATEGVGKDQYIQSVRTQNRVVIDGRLDEADWATAPVFDAFSQRFPNPGKAPSERTELKVLYDDKNIYFAVICHDSKPETIQRRLARRDSFVFSDAIQVSLDPTHDHRTGYMFFVNAGGVLSDGLFFDDRFFTSDWDGIWDGAAGVIEDGWVAELMIPLSLLRFPEAEVQTWGIDVRRDLPRENEEIDSVPNPRDSNANVSRFGHLTGMRGLKPVRSVEMVPYLAARSVFTPVYGDTGELIYTDGRNVLLPSADLGLDLKVPLTSDITLVGTVNPDFGQVEADQIIQNLSTFETSFPEKRPFFTQGMELFQPVNNNDGLNQSLFYSRRIGLDSSILGAVKVTGTAVKGVEIGILDAFVAGAGQGTTEIDNPERGFAYHFERPFHVGSEAELPALKPTPMNYLAAVARTSVGQNSNVGAMVTSALPIAPPCTEAEYSSAAPPSRCDVHAGNAASLRFDLKTADSAYGVLGQVVGSQSLGGPPPTPLIDGTIQGRQFADGTILQRGELGAGGFLRAGRVGGDGFRWDVGYDYASPELYLRPSGFLRNSNEHAARAALRYTNQRGFGPMKSFFFNSTIGTRWSADGRFVHRGDFFNINAQGQLPSFDFVGVEMGVDFNEMDIREVGGTGIPLQRPPAMFLVAFWETNQNRPIFVSGFGAIGLRWDQAPGRPPVGWGAEMRVTWRPTDALETSLAVFDDMTPHGPRYIGRDDPNLDVFNFAELESQFLSITLRQQVMLTPRLSLQAYAQLFTDWGRYGPYYRASSANRAPILLSDLQPVAGPATDPNFYSSRLNVNVVARWEYALGSTLFLVYTRSQGATIEDGASTPRTLLPIGLGRAPSTDSFMVKWSWYWDQRL